MYTNDFIDDLVGAVATALHADNNPSRLAAARIVVRRALDEQAKPLRELICKTCSDVNNAITPLILNAQLDTGVTPTGLQRTADAIKSLKEALR